MPANPAPQPFDVHERERSHVVIELFGGDNNLSHFVLEDLAEMAAGMGDSFAVLGLADFATSGASVIELHPETGSQVLEDWGEIDTGDPRVLAAFLSRALVSYAPEAHKALGFWDHGTGVFDEHDPDEIILERRMRRVPRWQRSRSVPARRLFNPMSSGNTNLHTRAMLHDTTNGGLLTNREARGVLQAAFEQAGQEEPIDLIFSDTCLNGMVEVLAEMGEFAQVIVASEDLEPGDGWDYFEWFARAAADPPEDGVAWGRMAVEAYEASYKDRVSAHPCTLGAFRTDQAISDRFKELVEACDGHRDEAANWFRAARDRTQAFANRDTYDLRDFATKLKAASDQEDVQDACDKLQEAFDAARVASTALGDMVEASHGLAFWFPTNGFNFKQVAPTYQELQFSLATGWADYLRERLFGT